MSSQHDDFYIGYFDSKGHPRTRSSRRAAWLFAASGLLLSALLVLSMRPFSKGVFEFGVVREFVGRVALTPYPVLELPRPQGGGSASRYLLVAFGKHGADEAVAEHVGRTVRVRGSLVHRGGQTMIELADGGIELLDASSLAPIDDALEQLGEQTLVGEIVDSKCFLGVMKPGDLKPHRACATRCIAGGIPPLLVVRDDRGESRQYLLVDADGSAINEHVLDRIAEPVALRGQVSRRGDLWFVHVDPTEIRRVN